MAAKELLSLLLPKFVLDGMQNFLEIRGETKVYDNVGDVTILFCDIADFDDVVRKNENNIVYILDRIVRRFDELCVVHGIQKIETVGKTYMAAGGMKFVENGLPHELKLLSFPYRTLDLAKDMMNVIKDFDGLNLKIGIHVGRPVMGVIGFHKPQFSLIGDVVNTTSRHCTTGEKGHIMLSREAYEILRGTSLLAGGYSLEMIKTEMKGKGKVDVYHLYPSQGKFKKRIQSIVEKASRLTQPDQLRDVEILERSFLISANNFSRKRSSLYDLTLQVSKNRRVLKKYADGGQNDGQTEPVSVKLRKLLSSEVTLPRPPPSTRDIELPIPLPLLKDKKDSEIPMNGNRRGNESVRHKDRDPSTFKQAIQTSMREDTFLPPAIHRDDTLRQSNGMVPLGEEPVSPYEDTFNEGDESVDEAGSIYLD